MGGCVHVLRELRLTNLGNQAERKVQVLLVTEDRVEEPGHESSFSFTGISQQAPKAALSPSAPAAVLVKWLANPNLGPPKMERFPLLPGAHRRSSRRTCRTHLLSLLGVALACAAAVYAQWMPLMQLVRWLNPSVVWFVDVPPGVRAAALTIDDSPRGDGSSTEAILDMLREAGVRATFFVISGQVRTERHRALLRRMVAEGHELANHGRAEERAILLSDDEYARSLRVCDAFLRQYQPALRWHRPGSGFVNARMLRRSAALGYTTVLGSVFPHDPIVKRAWHTAFFLEWRTRPGAVVIVHDRAYTAAALREALPAIAKRGISLGTLSQMLASAESGTPHVKSTAGSSFSSDPGRPYDGRQSASLRPRGFELHADVWRAEA
jgi:peptidoglycan/xylan/chitin deacetylase (PgdA/CDA1 family)